MQSFSYPKTLLQIDQKARDTFLHNVPLLAQTFIYKDPPPSFRDTALEVFKCFFQDSIPESDLYTMIAQAFPFKVPVFPIDPRTYVLDLTHGDSGFCTDFGAQMTAQLVNYFYRQSKLPLHVLFAGEAFEILSLAQAFAGLEDIHSTFLYPSGEVHSSIEQLLYSQPEHIHIFQIDGTLTDCKALIQKIANDTEVNHRLELFIPDTVQISYLLSYICCYIYAALTVQSRAGYDNNIELPRLIVGIPMRIPGGLSAAVAAQQMNAPISGFLTTVDSMYKSSKEAYSEEYTLLNKLYQGHKAKTSTFESDIAIYRFNQQKKLDPIRSCHERTGYLISPAAAELWHVWNEVKNGLQQSGSGYVEPRKTSGRKIAHLPVWITDSTAARSCISIIMEPSHPCFYTDAIKTATGKEPSVPHRFEYNLQILKEPAVMRTSPNDLKEWLLSLL
ncbi:threonine synthase [Treponema sp.]|uniref:threonine synthase n=1 Tax=Treponema sp. TaxID=166 RepID=UPI003FA313E2